MISIVVPCHNAGKFIGRCLDSIFSCKINSPFEVIVVDDGSNDDTRKIAQNFSCQYIRIEKSGVAKARNLGIKRAKGRIIFFFDADVRLKKDTIENFLRHFREDKDAYIIQGRWDENFRSPSFSSRFFLRKYSYNFKDLFKNKRRLEAANLETGCLALRKEVFNCFKGFDENYKFSGGEEHELGKRLSTKYKIYYYPDIFVEHTFGSISKSIKKIYHRTINFSILFFKEKNRSNFMNLHKVSVPLEDKISLVIIILAILASMFLFFNLKLALFVWAVLSLVYLINISRFLFYLKTTENISFAIAGIFANVLIIFPRAAGLLQAIYIFYILGRKEYKI